jgi:ParB family chromosome partitioning protein
VGRGVAERRRNAQFRTSAARTIARKTAQDPQITQARAEFARPTQFFSSLLELQVIENVQRVDVHPLDEAQGYAALIELQPDTYTVESISSRVGRSPAYISGRLRLIQLIAEAKQAFYDDKLTVAHAFEIARLQPNDQRRALQECFPHYRNAAAILKDKKAEATTVRELRAWIEREIHLDLTNAPFDPQDETLLPKAGACARCPKRTGSNPLLFPEVRQKSICTDRECYRAKIEAIVQIQVKPLEEKGEKPLRVSQAPAWQTNGHAKDVLFEGQYRKAKAKGEAPTRKPPFSLTARVLAASSISARPRNATFTIA